MARTLTTDQRNLLKSPDLKIRVLGTFHLDGDTVRICDDVEDITYAGNTYIGASALAEAVDIRSGADFAAEPITLILDGARMTQYGISDPLKVFSEMLSSLYSQRRVDWWLGFSASTERNINFALPGFAGKINSARLLEDEMDFAEQEQEPLASKLEIVIDSLATRYSRATYRTRSHEDQLEIDPTDMFFSFVSDVVANEQTIYWGKKAPRQKNAASGGGSGSSYNWITSRIYR